MPAISPRTWLRLGSTVLDLNGIVKIVFDSADARLFAVSGEALLMTAWTKERSDIARLKQHADVMNGWIAVQSEIESEDEERAGDPDERVRIEAVDRVVFVETSLGPAAELFTSGVFAGQVVGSEDIDRLEQQLGL